MRDRKQLGRIATISLSPPLSPHTTKEKKEEKKTIMRLRVNENTGKKPILTTVLQFQ